MPSPSIEDNSSNAAMALKQNYNDFLRSAANLFPKVDQKLLMNMLYFENTYSDWEGNVLLKIVYPKNADVDRKKEWIFQKYQRMGSIEEDRTLRFKAIRFYVDDIANILHEDPEIEYITGSATFTPSEAYSA